MVFYIMSQHKILTYLPTSGLDDEFGEVLSLLSLDILDNITQNTILIIGMDSNQSKKSTNRRTEMMNNFRSRFSLKSIHTDDQPTFHHNNQISNSQIDHIYFSVPETINNSICMNKILCKEQFPSNLSAHDLIIGQIRLNKQVVMVCEENYLETYSYFINLKPVWNEKLFSDYQIRAHQAAQTLFSSNENISIPELVRKFSEILVNTAKSVFKIKKHFT